MIEKRLHSALPLRNTRRRGGADWPEKCHGMGAEKGLYSSKPNFGKGIQIMKRIVTIVLLLFISIVFIAACAESENLIGTWKPQSLLLNGEPVDVPFEPLISMSSTYEFTERGTIRVTTADSWNYTSPFPRPFRDTFPANLPLPFSAYFAGEGQNVTFSQSWIRFITAFYK